MTSNKEKPLYSLTVGEYLEISKTVFAEVAEKMLQSKEQTQQPAVQERDIIFADEVIELTGYRKATLYSKVSRNEIPVLSRRTPLTFSRKAIVEWLKDGKPSVINDRGNTKK